MTAIDLVGLIQRAVSAGVTGVLLSIGHLAPTPVDPLPRTEESRSTLPWETNPWDGMPWDGTPWDTTQPHTPRVDTPQPDPLPTDPQPWDAPPSDPQPWDAPPSDPQPWDAPPSDPPPTDPPTTDLPLPDPPLPDPPATELPIAEPPRLESPPIAPPVVPTPKVPPAADPRTVQERTPDPTPKKAPPPKAPGTRTEPTRAPTTTTRDVPIRSEEFDTAPPARDVRSDGRTSVRDGVLTLSGPGALCWTGARTSGRWDVRMRVPAAAGAVLLAGADTRTGEIRFVDLDGPRASYAVRGDEGTTRGSTTVDAKGWHVWSVDWTPSAVVGLVDGKEWFRTGAPAVRGPLFLCLQARGAATLEVDHVREYVPRT